MGIRDRHLQRLADIVGNGFVQVGPGTTVYAVDGQVPEVVVRPGSVEEVAAVMALASSESIQVVPWGTGALMTLGGIPERVDLVLDLSRLRGVVDYEPADMTVTLRAGTRLPDAQAVVSSHGQWIPVDPPLADRVTIGGVLATNASGPRRFRYGAPRDFVLAVRVVHADGKVTKGGAKVVKSVAGYDMTKLYIGSLGTLAIIVEATFRLYPVPSVEKTVLVLFPSVEAAGVVITRLLDSTLAPIAIELLNPAALGRMASELGLALPGGFGLAVIFGSVNADAVHAQIQRLTEMSHGTSDVCVLEEDAHKSFWHAVYNLPLSSPVVLKASVPVAKVVDAFQWGQRLAERGGLATAMMAEAGSGIVWYYVNAPPVPPERWVESMATVITELRSLVQSWGGSLVVWAAPPAVKRQVDVWGSVGNALPIMQSLKAQFDPLRILNPGRFVGGI